MGRGALQATVHGILQARILEQVAISFSREENGTQITQIIIEHKFWRVNLCKINNKHKNVTVNHKYADVTNQTVESSS